MAEAAQTEAVRPRTTPYELIGGAAPVRAIVDRFYDLMDSDPAYAELRAMHAPDLTPMRESLAGFLNAWMGGPRTWFEQKQGCIMSIHSPLAIGKSVAEQWASAMTRAIEASDLPNRELADAMAQTLGRMASGMVR
jgi:hemoglobin